MLQPGKRLSTLVSTSARALLGIAGMGASSATPKTASSKAIAAGVETRK